MNNSVFASALYLISKICYNKLHLRWIFKMLHTSDTTTTRTSAQPSRKQNPTTSNFAHFVKQEE